MYAPLQREGHFPDAHPAAPGALAACEGAAPPAAALAQLAGLEASLPRSARAGTCEVAACASAAGAGMTAGNKPRSNGGSGSDAGTNSLTYKQRQAAGARADVEYMATLISAVKAAGSSGSGLRGGGSAPLVYPLGEHLALGDGGAGGLVAGGRLAGSASAVAAGARASSGERRRTQQSPGLGSSVPAGTPGWARASRGSDSGWDAPLSPLSASHREEAALVLLQALLRGRAEQAELLAGVAANAALLAELRDGAALGGGRAGACSGCVALGE